MAVMGIACAPTLLMPRAAARACLRAYLLLVFGGLQLICGVRYQVKGREHVPEGGVLVASKHQSMFETLAFWRILPDPAIILKKELAFLPVFGWYALKLRNIAVDRSAGSNALRAMLKAARERAGAGRQVVIFPQGTRVSPGAEESYKPGVAGLYAAMKAPCTPVALNSGLFWPKRGFMRRPGVITIEFLPAIPPGLPRDAFMQELERRIETASQALLPAPEASETARTAA